MCCVIEDWLQSVSTLDCRPFLSRGHMNDPYGPGQPRLTKKTECINIEVIFTPIMKLFIQLFY